MEDPTSFDVWIKGTPGSTAVVLELSRRAQPNLTRLEMHKLAARAALGEHVLLVPSVPRLEACQWRDELHAKRMLAFTVQEGQNSLSTQATSYCSIHDLGYGGCLGCPVCRGSALTYCAAGGGE